MLSDHNEFKELNNEDLAGMNDKRVFDTKNIVKSVPNDVEYMNYGNLYDFLKKEVSLA